MKDQVLIKIPTFLWHFNLSTKFQFYSTSKFLVFLFSSDVYYRDTTQHYSVCNTLGQISWELLNFLKKSSWTRLVAKTHMFDSKRLIVNWIYGLKSSGLRSKVIYLRNSKTSTLSSGIHIALCLRWNIKSWFKSLAISFTFQVFWVEIQD